MHFQSLIDFKRKTFFFQKLYFLEFHWTNMSIMPGHCSICVVQDVRGMVTWRHPFIPCLGEYVSNLTITRGVLLKADLPAAPSKWQVSSSGFQEFRARQRGLFTHWWELQWQATVYWGRNWHYWPQQHLQRAALERSLPNSYSSWTNLRPSRKWGDGVILRSLLPWK